MRSRPSPVLRGLALCCLALAALGAGAGRSRAATAPDPDRLVLVLSGGGARGTAHIGVLKVLEEQHIVPDMIVGTSMGSIIGGLYAAGYSPDEIGALVKTIDWDGIFFDSVPRHSLSYRRKQDDTPWFIPFKLRFADGKPYLPGGVLGGQRLDLLLRQITAQATAERDFDDLPIPYRAVAMDLSTGEAVVIDSGSLADAMRASMAIPGALPPVERDGRQLVDGGSAANLPVGIARDLGGTRIIAVNISTPLDTGTKDRSWLQVMNQLTAFLTTGSVQSDLKLLQDGDVLITPDLGDISFKSFDRMEEAVAIGEAAARAQEKDLARFGTTPERWDEFRSRHVRDDVTRRPVRSVAIDHEGWVDDRVVERRIDVPLGEPLDQDDLLRQLELLRGLKVFGPMAYGLQAEGDGSRLGIDIEPPETGRANLQFGALWRTDFDGDSGFGLMARHQWLAVNRLNGEWVNVVQIGEKGLLHSEFLQPLDWRLNWFVKPAVRAMRTDLALWFDGARVTDYEVSEYEGSLEMGRFLGRWGSLSATLFRGRDKGDVQIGLPQFPSFEDSTGGFRVDFDVDTRDQALFPTRGANLRTRLERNLETFGSDRTWTVVDVQWSGAMSLGRGTLAPRLELRSNLDGDATVATAAFIGGFQRLSGLGDNELFGDHGGVFSLDYYYEILGLDLGPLSSRIFAGLTLEAGNAYFDDEPITWPSLRTGASLYVGAATPLGALYLGGGWTDPDRRRIYMVLGSRF